MDFKEAFVKLMKGCSIKRPGMGYAYTMKNGKLYKEYGEHCLHEVVQIPSSMLPTFARSDWEVQGLVQPEVSASAQSNVIIKYRKLNREEMLGPNYMINPCPSEPQAPEHAHEDDTGFDLLAVAAEYLDENTLCYHSGLAFQFPDGIYAELRARSSIYKTGLILANGVGTIDHGYTGEVKGVFYRLTGQSSSKRNYFVGNRFAQLVIPGIDPRRIVFEEVKEFTKTDRGDGGFGSTGR